MTQTIVYYLIALNIATFFVYGITSPRRNGQNGVSEKLHFLDWLFLEVVSVHYWA